MMSGKAVARAVLAHSLASTALGIILMRNHVNSMEAIADENNNIECLPECQLSSVCSA